MKILITFIIVLLIAVTAIAQKPNGYFAVKFLDSANKAISPQSQDYEISIFMSRHQRVISLTFELDPPHTKLGLSENDFFEFFYSYEDSVYVFYVGEGYDETEIRLLNKRYSFPQNTIHTGV